MPDGLTNPKINRQLPAQPTQTWPPGKARTVNGLASRHQTPRAGTTSARSSLGTQSRLPWSASEWLLPYQVAFPASPETFLSCYQVMMWWQSESESYKQRENAQA